MTSVMVTTLIEVTDDQNGVVTPVTVTSVYNAGVVTTPDSQMTKMV